MKSAISAVAVAAVLAFTPLAGGTFAAADDSAQPRSHFGPEDRAAFLDARIAALKAGLELTADQEKIWPPLESAIRDLARPASPHGGRRQRRAPTGPATSIPSIASPEPRSG